MISFTNRATYQAILRLIIPKITMLSKDNMFEKSKYYQYNKHYFIYNHCFSKILKI